jgi:hypothetical protein
MTPSLHTGVRRVWKAHLTIEVTVLPPPAGPMMSGIGSAEVRNE